DPRLEPLVDRARAEPRMRFLGKNCGNGGRLLSGLVLPVRREEPERAAVGRELLDVEGLEPMRAQDPHCSPQRKVRKMLMIDGVELGLLDQPKQMRKFEGQHSVRLQG